MKIDLEIEVKNGRLLLNNKPYSQLNDHEKEVVNGAIKKMKLKTLNE